MTAQRVSTPQRGGRGCYHLHQPAVTAIPLTLAGLYAVHVQEPADATTHIYYCEPATGRCSCGAPAGACPHLAAAVLCPDAPQQQDSRTAA